MKFSKIRRFVILNTVVVLLFVLALYYDTIISSTISYVRYEWLTDFFLGITFFSSLLIIFLFLTLLFIKENKRRWIVPLWMTLIADIIVGFVLKIVIQRPRPFELGLIPLIGLIEKSYTSWNYSFPSFQTMMIFSAIPFLSKEFPKFKYFWVIFAVLVGLSRVYLGVHFLSDVIAGALIGYLIGFFIARRSDRIF